MTLEEGQSGEDLTSFEIGESVTVQRCARIDRGIAAREPFPVYPSGEPTLALCRLAAPRTYIGYRWPQDQQRSAHKLSPEVRSECWTRGRRFSWPRTTARDPSSWVSSRCQPICRALIVSGPGGEKCDECFGDLASSFTLREMPHSVENDPPVGVLEETLFSFGG